MFHNINSNEESKEIGDTHDLIGLDQWTGVNYFYTYAGTPANPQLIVHFALNTQRYYPFIGLKSSAGDPPTKDSSAKDVPVWQQNAIDDQKRFAEINSQLTRLYEDANASKRTGHVVSLSLIHTLLSSEIIELDETQAQSIRDFVAESLAYLNNRVAEQNGGLEPVCRLEIFIAPGLLSNSNVIELSLALRLEREIANAPAAGASVTETITVETKIPPLTSSQSSVETSNPKNDFDDPISSLKNITAFAEAFESVFLTGDREIHIGMSVPSPQGPVETDVKWSSAVYAVRPGIKTGKILNNKIEHINFYAPKTVAGSLASATVPIGTYSTGATFPVVTEHAAFGGVDLNLWTETALTAIDSFPASGSALQLMILESPAADDPEIQEIVTKILNHKKTIFEAIAKTITPIFDYEASEKIDLFARENFYHSFSAGLSAAAKTIETVLVADEKNRDDTLMSGLYGHLQASPAPAKIGHASDESDIEEQPYPPTGGKVRYFKVGESEEGVWLLFLCSPENAGKQTLVLDQLTFKLTHLEYIEKSVPDSTKPRQSIWIEFITAPHVTLTGTEAVELLAVTRILPAPPVIISQRAVSSRQMKETETAVLLPSELTSWDYSLTFSHHNIAQDSVTANLTFSSNDNQDVLQSNTQNPLFAPLAQFVTVYPQILADLETYLPATTSSSDLSQANIINAKAALKAFEAIVSEVAAGFETLAKQNRVSPGGENLLQAASSFESVLKPDARGNARIDVVPPSDSDIKKLSSLPIIGYKSYTAIPAVDKPDDALISYNYESGGAPSPDNLSYKQALEIAERSITINNLSIYRQRHTAIELRIVRNRHLLSGLTTNSEFVFLSGPVKPTSPFTPSLRYQDFDLQSLAVDSSTLKNYLAAFFASLFEDAGRIPLKVKIVVSYSFQTEDVPDFPRTRVPVTMLSPLFVQPEKGVPLPFISPLVSAIRDWQTINQPEHKPASQYNFKVEVFDAESADAALQAPLLMIENLFIAVGKIVFF